MRGDGLRRGGALSAGNPGMNGVTLASSTLFGFAMRIQGHRQSGPQQQVGIRNFHQHFHDLRLRIQFVCTTGNFST